MRKILEVQVKTLDDKNHIKIWTKDDVVLDSIKFNIDQPIPKAEKKTAPVETKKGDSKKDGKKDSKKK